MLNCKLFQVANWNLMPFPWFSSGMWIALGPVQTHSTHYLPITAVILASQAITVFRICAQVIMIYLIVATKYKSSDSYESKMSGRSCWRISFKWRDRGSWLHKKRKWWYDKFINNMIINPHLELCRKNMLLFPGGTYCESTHSTWEVLGDGTWFVYIFAYKSTAHRVGGSHWGLGRYLPWEMER